MKCQWLATFTLQSPEYREVCLFRLVFGDHVSYLEVRDGGVFKWMHYGPDKVEALVEELRRKGYTEAKRVGRWAGGTLAGGKVEWVGFWLVGWVELVGRRGE